MFIYSTAIHKFIQHVTMYATFILTYEAKLKTLNNRFYNKNKTISYPIKIIIYNNKTMLGYFDPSFLELGFHESLMHVSEAQLMNIIRHELAHYLTFIEFGSDVGAHSAEFRTLCKNLGWGKEVYEACCTLEFNPDTALDEETTVLRRIKKLMALAGSSNVHEAEQAMIKSRELLLKHNIDNFCLGNDIDDKLYLKRILKQKKANAKMRAIAHILATFFVNTVYTRGDDHIYLEILGTAINVEIAEYVALFLETELETLWNAAQKKANLRGTIAKNSFFLGVATGYCNKVEALKKDCSIEESRGLIVIEKQLIEAAKIVYPRLRHSKSAGNHCGLAAAVGQQMGQQLNINPALGRQHQTPLLIE